MEEVITSKTQGSPPEEWWPGSNLQELLQREDLLQCIHWR
nr:MAG TPA: hypothetical protein [Caudoviricetes sp.]